MMRLRRVNKVVKMFTAILVGKKAARAIRGLRGRPKKRTK